MKIDFSNRKCRVIAFDGGPVTPLNLRILREIERRRSFIEKTDIFAGTSDGSFAALFLASWPWKEGREKFGEKAGLVALEEAIVFSDSVFTSFSPSFLGRVGNFCRLVGGRRSAMPQNNVKNTLYKHFGERRLGEIEKFVVVPTFRLKSETRDGNRKPDAKVYHNFRPEDPDSHERILDVVMRSGALPIFMPIWKGHLDGAIWANNPSMCAIAQWMMHPDSGPFLDDDEDIIDGFRKAPQRDVHELENMVVLSLGGDSPEFGNSRIQQKFQNEQVSWGWFPWMLYPKEIFLLFDAFWGGGSRGPAYQARALLNERFFRMGQVTERIIKQIIRILLLGTRELVDKAEELAQEWARGAQHSMGGEGDTIEQALAWVDTQWNHTRDLRPGEAEIPLTSTKDDI